MPPPPPITPLLKKCNARGVFYMNNTVYVFRENFKKKYQNTAELQLRRGNRDNLEMISVFFHEKHML